MAQVVSEKIEAKDSLNVSPRRYPASLGLWPRAKADSGPSSPAGRLCKVYLNPRRATNAQAIPNLAQLSPVRCSDLLGVLPSIAP
jgi:hypothetical protein